MQPVITGGVTSIYVLSMDDAIQFYTAKLGLALKTRIENEWAVIDAGKGFLIGLHPFNAGTTVAPGTTGTINIEFQIPSHVNMEEFVKELKEQGVKFKNDVVTYEHVKLATFLDPSGNELIIGQEV